MSTSKKIYTVPTLYGVATRTSNRIYTHAVVTKFRDDNTYYKGLLVIGFSGSYSLAEKVKKHQQKLNSLHNDPASFYEIIIVAITPDMIREVKPRLKKVKS